jgi:hypothetical protein
VHLDSHGRPIPFTISVAGFAPSARVFVEQCDGVSGDDPNFRPTIDCDLGTQSGGQRADAHGRVTFPANDINFGFRPVRGQSPEKLFDCLAPRDPDPHNGLKSWQACQVRIASNIVQPTPDQLFITMHFTMGSPSRSDLPAAVLTLVAAISFGAIVWLYFSRRRRTAAKS